MVTPNISLPKTTHCYPLALYDLRRVAPTGGEDSSDMVVSAMLCLPSIVDDGFLSTQLPVDSIRSPFL